MRKTVRVELKIVVTMNVDEGADVSEIVNEADYDFKDTTGAADIEDTRLDDYRVTDSR